MNRNHVIQIKDVTWRNSLYYIWKDNMGKADWANYDEIFQRNRDAFLPQTKEAGCLHSDIVFIVPILIQ